MLYTSSGGLRNEMQKNKNLKSGQKPDLPRTRRPYPLRVVPTPGGRRPLCAAPCQPNGTKKDSLSAVLSDAQGMPLPLRLYSVVPRYHNNTYMSRMESHLYQCPAKPYSARL